MIRSEMDYNPQTGMYTFCVYMKAEELDLCATLQLNKGFSAPTKEDMAVLLYKLFSRVEKECNKNT